MKEILRLVKKKWRGFKGKSHGRATRKFQKKHKGNLLLRNMPMIVKIQSKETKMDIQPQKHSDSYVEEQSRKTGFSV